MLLTTSEEKMENPWKEISKKEKVLKMDKEKIFEHNERYKSNDERLISLDYFPEPFIGDPKAEIYLLLGNPGMEVNLERRIEITEKMKNNSDYYIRNLKHQAVNPRFPLYFLDDNFETVDRDGHNWWKKALGKLTNENVTFENISKSFFAVETYGYHSAKGEPKMRNLPSSKYSHHLIRRAINKGKLIILARAVSIWFEHVTELKTYDNCYFLASNMGIRLSETTLSPRAFKQVRRILEKSK